MAFVGHARRGDARIAEAADRSRQFEVARKEHLEMKRNWTRELLIGFGTWITLAANIAFGAVTDGSIKKPTNYYGFQPPALGASYSDPVFGTSIKRLSNAPTRVNSA